MKLSSVEAEPFWVAVVVCSVLGAGAIGAAIAVLVWLQNKKNQTVNTEIGTAGEIEMTEREPHAPSYAAEEKEQTEEASEAII